MGMNSGDRVAADDFDLISRSTCVIVVNPCRERVSLTPEEARKLAGNLIAAAVLTEQRQQKQAEYQIGDWQQTSE